MVEYELELVDETPRRDGYADRPHTPAATTRFRSLFRRLSSEMVAYAVSRTSYTPISSSLDCISLFETRLSATPKIADSIRQPTWRPPATSVRSRRAPIESGRPAGLPGLTKEDGTAAAISGGISDYSSITSAARLGISRAARRDWTKHGHRAANPTSRRLTSPNHCFWRSRDPLRAALLLQARHSRYLDWAVVWVARQAEPIVADLYREILPAEISPRRRGPGCVQAAR